MPRSPDHRTSKLEEHLAELEVLIERWRQAQDPDSRWMLYLLEEAAAIGRLKLNGPDKAGYEPVGRSA